jgi:hypothetical protein
MIIKHSSKILRGRIIRGRGFCRVGHLKQYGAGNVSILKDELKKLLIKKKPAHRIKF